jgi:serine/threonine protein phosphatase PrpC
LDVSPDHRPSKSTGAAGAAEIARIIAAGGWVKDGRALGVLSVSRGFGDHEFKAGRQQFLKDGVALKYFTPAQVAGVTLAAPVVVATPDVSQVELTPRDEFVIVATDGLWDYCSSAQAVQFVRSELARNGRDAQAAAEALAEHAVGRRRSKDNIAVAIVLLGGDA